MGMHISFHTDAFNSSNWSFEQCLAWAQKQGLHHIECGAYDGVSYMLGLGYSPHVALQDDPRLLRRKMDNYGIEFSQVDVAYPLSGEDGLIRGVPYILKAIPWAAHVGCPCLDTTDGLHAAQGLTDKESVSLMKRCYQQILRVAEAYGITINIEPHGYYTTNPEMMAEMLAFVDSPLLGMNMDTGNTFIAGRDPVAFLKQFVDKIRHVHLKDVSQALADAVRGGQTGIAMSQCALGEGVNAENIRNCLKLLRDRGYQGALSIECDGTLIEKSLAWVRQTLKDLGIKDNAAPKATRRAKR